MLPQNPTLSGIYPGQSTLNVMRTLDPTYTLAPNVGSFGPAGYMHAILWYDGEEQFVCQANKCNQTTTDTSADWSCNSLECQCRPGATFCGKGPVSLLSTLYTSPRSRQRVIHQPRSGSESLGRHKPARRDCRHQVFNLWRNNVLSIPAGHDQGGVRRYWSTNERLHLRRVREAKRHRLLDYWQNQLRLDQYRQRGDSPFGRCHRRPGCCRWLGSRRLSSPALGIYHPKTSKTRYHGRSQDWWCHCRVDEYRLFNPLQQRSTLGAIENGRWKGHLT